MPRPQDLTSSPSTAGPIITPEDSQPGAYGRTRAAPAPGNQGGTGASTRDVIGQAKQTISNVASQAGDQVVSRLDTQKERAAEGLGGVAQALRQTGDQLRQQDDRAAAHQYVSSAANQVERLSGYLRSTNVREIVSNVEQFAREQPALFLGSAFVLGLLGARFLKSSAQPGSAAPDAVARSESPDSVDAYSGTTMAREGYAGDGAQGTAGYGSPSGASSI